MWGLEKEKSNKKNHPHIPLSEQEQYNLKVYGQTQVSNNQRYDLAKKQAKLNYQRKKYHESTTGQAIHTLNSFKLAGHETKVNTKTRSRSMFGFRGL